MRILWLRPSKPDNISVGRERIAHVLRSEGDEVKLIDASGWDALRAIYEGLSSDYDAVVGTVRMGLYVGFVIHVLDRTPLLADVTDPIEQVSDLPTVVYQAVQHFEDITLQRANARVFLYTSSYERAKSRDIDGVKLNNGVNFERFSNPDPKLKSEAKTLLSDEFDESKKTAVYIGGLEPVYNISVVLQAAEDLSEWNFIFVGDGTLSNKVKRASNRQANVFYPGSVRYEIVPGILSLGDVGLCLVDAEQPLKVLEYGAAGLPTIALSGELEQRFPDGALYYIKPTQKDLEDALQTLGNSPKEMCTYRDRLREIAKEYSWNEIGDRYREILIEISQ